MIDPNILTGLLYVGSVFLFGTRWYLGLTKGILGFVLLSVIVCLASKLLRKLYLIDYSGGRGADADAVYVDKEILRSGGLFNCELKQSSPECLDRGAPALYNGI